MDFLADVYKARVATVAVFREAAEQGMSVGEAIYFARAYLKHKGYPVPDDPLAFATGGRSTMFDGDLRDTFVAKSSGEIL